MDDERTRGFRIDFSDDEPEAPVAAPEPEKTPDQPSSIKPALISVFAFCVLGALLFVGYYQLNNRINRIDNSGAHEIEDLRGQIEGRLDDFSKKLLAQNGAMNKRFEEIEKKLQENADAVGKLHKQLNSTQETAQSVPSIINRLSAYIAEVDQLKADMESRIGAVDERLQTLEENASELEAVQLEIRNLQENIGRARTEIGKLLESRIDQKTINNAVNQAVSGLRSEVNRELEATQEQMQSRMTTLQDQVDALDQIIKTLRDISKRPSPVPGQTGGPAQPTGPAGDTGKIREQEIQ